tara:strand:- start:1087 stop:1392 length:306 start_codon:yes stop_codon:yes gene_type:complete
MLGKFKWREMDSYSVDPNSKTFYLYYGDSLTHIAMVNTGLKGRSGSVYSDIYLSPELRYEFMGADLDVVMLKTEVKAKEIIDKAKKDKNFWELLKFFSIKK